MIYLDTSVLLAWLLAEDRVPPPSLWSETLVSSRLLEYETWTRLHALGLADSHADEARDLLGRVALVEMTPPVLTRALEPFPVPVRTLDALHLATMTFLERHGALPRLASYDEKVVLPHERTLRASRGPARRWPWCRRPTTKTGPARPSIRPDYACGRGDLPRRGCRQWTYNRRRAGRRR